MPVLRPAPHPTRLRRATITFFGIAATGSYKNFDSLRDAPPQGKAFFGLEKPPAFRRWLSVSP